MITTKVFNQMVHLAHEMDTIKCGFRDLFLEEAYQQLVERFGYDANNVPMPYLQVGWMRLGRAKTTVMNVGVARLHRIQTQGKIPNRFRRTS